MNDKSKSKVKEIVKRLSQKKDVSNTVSAPEASDQLMGMPQSSPFDKTLPDTDRNSL